MKRIIYTFLLCLLFSACNAYQDLHEAQRVEKIAVDVNLSLEIQNIVELKDLKLKFNNYDEGITYAMQMDALSSQMEGLIPGIYTVNATGVAIDAAGTEYYINGSVVNHGIFKDGDELNLDVKGLKVSPLIFKEIYFACSRTPLNKSYIYDQFYELYNNSSSVIYLDGLHFANLHPDRSSTTLPLWPEEDGDDYVYAQRVWKFPGSGQDYPLQPGESCVISQFATNHQMSTYNPNSPMDNSSADFEFYMDNANYPDKPAPNMEHVFYNGKAQRGTLKQYLTSVFGSAYVVFDVPEGESWDPVGDPKMKTRDLSGTKSTLYAKVPIRYVLDAVEAIDNESKMNAKRVPGVLDAGITWVGATYNGLGVNRKFSLDEAGEPLRRSNGAYIYQDTNNSTDDFNRGVAPVLRRNGARMPSWNHTN